jgi:hypothetical protein
MKRLLKFLFFILLSIFYKTRILQSAHRYVSDMYPVRIRTRYSVKTYPWSIRKKTNTNKSYTWAIRIGPQ